MTSSQALRVKGPVIEANRNTEPESRNANPKPPTMLSHISTLIQILGAKNSVFFC